MANRILLIISLCIVMIITVNSFKLVKHKINNNIVLKNSLFNDISTNILLKSSIYLSDTSISEEEVLSVTGTSTTLPDPIFAITFAGVILLGIAILQFSLGDLTKEEGQARVRDFLKTRSETERKRGYFD
uniref:Uncharacterized protein n=1 Tax=Chromulina nebulosa TaxID=96789 RepID=A0A7S0SW18_9STRA|mmetsp:Transcript_3882/g.3482  ORF Transcript_3882/g.3482 Transcript_3882/m.3482 type:complete len:130 (+) Transcript_3882:2-391(+)